MQMLVIENPKGAGIVGVISIVDMYELETFLRLSRTLDDVNTGDGIVSIEIANCDIVVICLFRRLQFFVSGAPLLGECARTYEQDQECEGVFHR
jgi:hypothetical protein